MGRWAMSSRIERAVAAVSKLSLAVAAVACLSCLALVCYGVAMRYFLGRPQSWADEAVGWLVVIVVMLAVPEAQRRGENIGVDWLVERWSGAKRRAVLALGALSVAAVAVMFVVEGAETVMFTRMVGIVSNALPEVPLWAIQGLIPLGGLLLLLVALAQLAAWASGREPEGYESGGRLDTHE
ncbi:MAG: TRAP transporter small permease [Alphaproteobacteria bacterium]|nr:TRAP transporter small permease [Alphaproteobacteria bacterium]